MNNILHLKTEAFAGPKSLSPEMVKVAAGRPMVVMVHADWCRHCKNFLPTFQKAADSKQIPVIFAGVAESGEHLQEGAKELIGKLGVKGFPTLLLFDTKGQLIPDAKFDRRSLEAFVKSLQTALS